MTIAFAQCPVCKQKLALQSYMQVIGTRFVCANPDCDTNIKVTGNNPLKIELLPESETRDADARPESYG